MMKSTFIFILLIFCTKGFGQYKESVLDEKSFKAGEKLNYSVKFGFIVGGHASLVLKQAYFNNKIVYHARGEGKTVGLAQKLYNVKDVFESYFDTNSLLPYKSVRDVKEGNYKKHDEAVFNRGAGTVYSTRKDTVIKVPPLILDMVSLLYYLRSLDFTNIREGDVLHTVTFFDEEIFPFDIRYKGKENLKTQFGKIRCLRFDPVVEPGRMFESEDDMTMWISDDNNRIPVRVKFDLLVGSLHMELSDFANLKFPLGLSQ
jgi:hypothetical protein